MGLSKYIVEPSKTVAQKREYSNPNQQRKNQQSNPSIFSRFSSFRGVSHVISRAKIPIGGRIFIVRNDAHSDLLQRWYSISLKRHFSCARIAIARWVNFSAPKWLRPWGWIPSAYFDLLGLTPDGIIRFRLAGSFCLRLKTAADSPRKSACGAL
jgi:hypothetical protein